MIQLTFAKYKRLFHDTVMANRTPVLLGEPGIGKSSFIKDYANALQTKVFILKVNSLAGREDLTGQRLIPTNEDRSDWAIKFFPSLVVSNAVAYAKEHPNETPILFLDEFNRTTPDVTSAIFQFITEREVGDIKLPDNIRLVAAGNDTGNVTAPDSASVNRLLIAKIKPDLGTFLEVNPKLNPYVKAYLTSHGNHLLDVPSEASMSDMMNNDDDQFEEESLFVQHASPRSWEYLSDVLNTAGFNSQRTQEEGQTFEEYMEVLDDQNATLMSTLIHGYLGETPAAVGFVEYMNNEFQNFTLSTTPVSVSVVEQNINIFEQKLDDASQTEDLVDLSDWAINTKDATLMQYICSDSVTDPSKQEILLDLILSDNKNGKNLIIPIISLKQGQSNYKMSEKLKGIIEKSTSANAKQIIKNLNAMGIEL